MPHPPRQGKSISIEEWESSRQRLRPFLLPSDALELYNSLAASDAAARMSRLARIGIGYVTGANDFFHLRPSIASGLGINRDFLVPAVRNSRNLVDDSIGSDQVERWRALDEPNFLLRLRRGDVIPTAVKAYLDSSDGSHAQQSYKCRNRRPWYVVPDVQIPDGFLSYMSGRTPSLVANRAGCVGTNSVHIVRLKPGVSIASIQKTWSDPLTQLSCEIEGHPLGGGMLKLEPREAGQVLVRRETTKSEYEHGVQMDAVLTMRRWRHYG